MQKGLGRGARVNAIYPSKRFFSDAKRAINGQEIFEISIKEGWRGRLLAKEVGSWLPVGDAAEIGGGLFKAPSITCGLLMLPLVTVHYFALSAKYEMHSKVNGNSVVLTYSPLPRSKWSDNGN